MTKCDMGGGGSKMALFGVTYFLHGPLGTGQCLWENGPMICAVTSKFVAMPLNWKCEKAGCPCHTLQKLVMAHLNMT